jgi:hypothetical protein
MEAKRVSRERRAREEMEAHAAKLKGPLRAAEVESGCAPADLAAAWRRAAEDAMRNAVCRERERSNVEIARMCRGAREVLERKRRVRATTCATQPTRCTSGL